MPIPLLLLCLLLMLWQPVSVGLSASRVVGSLAFRGWPVSIVLAVRLAVAAVGVAAGRTLLSRRPGALKLARAALVAGAATDLFVYLTPYYPGNRAPGETPVLVAFTAIYYAGWLLYLSKSARVRSLFVE